MTTRDVRTFKHNQQRGKDFEHRFMDFLSRNGFWVHFITPAPDGSQPFDIIACKDGIAYAFDCKTLCRKSFPLSRVEDNQRTAFQLMNKKRNYLTYFVIEVEENRVRIVPSQSVEKAIQAGMKSIVLEGFPDAYIGSE